MEAFVFDIQGNPKTLGELLGFRGFRVRSFFYGLSLCAISSF